MKVSKVESFKYCFLTSCILTGVHPKLFPESVEVISVDVMENISVIYAKGLETGEIHEKIPEAKEIYRFLSRFSEEQFVGG